MSQPQNQADAFALAAMVMEILRVSLPDAVAKAIESNVVKEAINARIAKGVHSDIVRDAINFRIAQELDPGVAKATINDDVKAAININEDEAREIGLVASMASLSKTGHASSNQPSKENRKRPSKETEDEPYSKKARTAPKSTDTPVAYRASAPRLSMSLNALSPATESQQTPIAAGWTSINVNPMSPIVQRNPVAARSTFQAASRTPNNAQQSRTAPDAAQRQPVGTQAHGESSGAASNHQVSNGSQQSPSMVDQHHNGSLMQGDGDEQQGENTEWRGRTPPGAIVIDAKEFFKNGKTKAKKILPKSIVDSMWNKMASKHKRHAERNARQQQEDGFCWPVGIHSVIGIEIKKEENKKWVDRDHACPKCEKEKEEDDKRESSKKRGAACFYFHFKDGKVEGEMEMVILPWLSSQK